MNSTKILTKEKLPQRQPCTELSNCHKSLQAQKKNNTLLPFWPSKRPPITISMVLYFGPKTSKKTKKTTSNRTKKSDTKSEAFQCPESNAIIDPGTMVIHLQNTGLTWATPEEWSWLPDFLTAKAPEHNPRNTRRSLLETSIFRGEKR